MSSYNIHYGKVIGVPLLTITIHILLFELFLHQLPIAINYYKKYGVIAYTTNELITTVIVIITLLIVDILCILIVKSGIVKEKEKFIENLEDFF